MERELKELKVMLRSLVVSSAAAMDVSTLVYDYRRFIGGPLPCARFGYRDPVTFLRECCSDCFLFQGPQTNPMLTLIVPDSLKYIDELVQKQKTALKGRIKRKSVPQSSVKPEPRSVSKTATRVSLIENTCRKNNNENMSTNQSFRVNSFIKKEIPMIGSLQAVEKINNTSQNKGLWVKRPSVPMGAASWAGCERNSVPSVLPSAPPPASSSDFRQFVRPYFKRPDSPNWDVEDALPGVPYEPNVFPADCIHYTESIPRLGMNDLQVNDTIDVITAEVYSPSHMWLIRLGVQYNEAMEAMMDEMNEYYRGAGRDREPAVGAVRIGHHMACCYLGDWHRAKIVRQLDEDTVQVRHIDYGTVQRVAARDLRPLMRCWMQLPAQAMRARLAGVRPAAGARRWQHAAALQMLRILGDRPLKAEVAVCHPQEEIVEVYLMEYSGGSEVMVHRELIAEGHADPATGGTQQRLFELPRFEALESAATPTLDELLTFLRVGIDPDCVREYREHVPRLIEPLKAELPSDPSDTVPPGTDPLDTDQPYTDSPDIDPPDTDVPPHELTTTNPPLIDLPPIDPPPFDLPPIDSPPIDLPPIDPTFINPASTDPPHTVPPHIDPSTFTNPPLGSTVLPFESTVPTLSTSAPMIANNMNPTQPPYIPPIVHRPPQQYYKRHPSFSSIRPNIMRPYMLPHTQYLPPTYYVPQPYGYIPMFPPPRGLAGGFRLGPQEGSVTLSMIEWEVFAVLARIQPELARQFIAERQRPNPPNANRR